MRDAVTSQLVRHYLSRFTAIISKQPFEKPLSSCAVASCLQKHIDYLSVLINRSPQILMVALDLQEHFADEKCISKSLMSTLQPIGVFGSKLVTPQANRLIACCNTSFSQ
jgi:hypothetical protein